MKVMSLWSLSYCCIVFILFVMLTGYKAYVTR
jgi:hypothetical protein